MMDTSACNRLDPGQANIISTNEHMAALKKCFVLQDEVSTLKQELHILRLQCKEKDEIIKELKQEIQAVKSKDSNGPGSSNQQDKNSLTLQNNVKVCVSDQSAHGFEYDFSLAFSHPDNRIMTARIRKDFIDTDGDGCPFSGAEIENACHAYFTNKKRDEKRKSSGLYTKHKHRSRSNKRKRTKLHKRREALSHARTNMSEEDGQMAHCMLYTVGMAAISSEEDPSSDEDITPDRRRIKLLPEKKVRKTIKLPWESLKTSDMKLYLDEFQQEHLASEKSKNLKWKVIKDSSCPVSERPCPENAPDWMING